MNRRQLLSLAAGGSAGFAFVQPVGAATLLTFDNQGPNGGTPPVSESYGDNITLTDVANGITASAGVDGITGTPDITVAYNPNPGNGEWDSYPAWDGRGDVLQSDYRSGDLSLDFQPAAGKGVLLSSFVLDEWGGGGDSVIQWSIVNSDTQATVVSGTWDDFSNAKDAGDGGGRSTILTGMTTAQAKANAGSMLTLLLKRVGGLSSYQALDNLAFDEVNAPTTPVEEFRVLAISKAGDMLTLTWKSASGQTFAIEESTDLGNLDTWTVVPGGDALPADAGDTTSVTFNVSGEGAVHFYRVHRN